MVFDPRSPSLQARTGQQALQATADAAAHSERARRSGAEPAVHEVPSASLALRAACADPGGLGPLAPFLYRFCDTAVAVGGLCAAFVLSNLGAKQVRFGEFLAMRLSVKNVLLLIGFAIAWRATCTLCGLYEWRRIASLKAEGTRVLLACALGSMAAIAFPLASVSGAFTYQTLLLFAIGTSLGMAALRGTLRLVVAARPRPAKSILMVGSGRLAAEAVDRLRADPDVVYHLAGLVDSRCPPARPDSQPDWPAAPPPYVGALDELEALLMHSAIDEVVVALPVKSHYSEIQRVVEVCERLGVAVTLPAQPFRASRAAVRLRQSTTLPAVTLAHAPAGVRLVVKRIIDVGGAAVGIIALAPLMLLAAAAIKLTSPGPVLFGQERYGYNRRVFRMHKFRTMVADAEARQAELEHLNEASGPLFKIRYDPRITRVGRVLRRTSIDELPQLFNVLRGDMSLVGPRPMAIRDVYQFPESGLMRRFSVRPGITGLWQVRGRSQLDYEAWADLDLKYIDEWSLARDLGILLLTVPAVLTGRGAQ